MLFLTCGMETENVQEWVSQFHFVLVRNFYIVWDADPTEIQKYWQSPLYTTAVKPSDLLFDEKNLRQVTSNQTRKIYVKPS